MTKPNLKAEITLEWADGIYPFALKCAQIEELEKLCETGIGRIVMGVFSGLDFKFITMRETIRLGLIGGGMAPVEAARKVAAYVDGSPIDNQNDPYSNLKTASKILQAIWFGIEDVSVGEQEGG